MTNSLEPRSGNTERLWSTLGRTSYFLIVIAVVWALTLGASHPVVVLIASAVLCGWSEVDGNCGTSHVCTISPIWNMDKLRWLASVAAYTVGGVISAIGIGVASSWIGSTLSPPRTIAFSLVVAISMLLILRELRIISFAIPQVHRQTHKMWFAEYGIVAASAMWGFHIGLGYATVIKHGALFALSAFALLLEPKMYAITMVSFWLGRTLPIWLAPCSLGSTRDSSVLLEEIDRGRTAIGLSSIAGLVMLLVGAALLGSID